MKRSLSAIGSALALTVVLASCGTTPVSLKDGTYTQHQTYKAGGNNEYEFYLDVTTTLADSKITAMSVAGDPNGQVAQKFATEFKSGMESKVVGKTLEEAKKIGYVSGASLASQAFTDALSAIEVQASGTGTTTVSTATSTTSTGTVSVSTGETSTGTSVAQ